MTPTRLRLLAVIAAVAAVVGWMVATLADDLAGRYLPVPWTAAAAVWLLAAGLGMWSWIVRPRLLRRPGTLPLPPYVAARTAALALAASRVGAGVLGAYAGIALSFLPSMHIPAATTAAIVAAVTAVGGLVMTVVALWLERMCRLPEGDDEDKESAGDPALGGIAGTERPSA